MTAALAQSVASPFTQAQSVALLCAAEMFAHAMTAELSTNAIDVLLDDAVAVAVSPMAEILWSGVEHLESEADLVVLAIGPFAVSNASYIRINLRTSTIEHICSDV